MREVVVQCKKCGFMAQRKDFMRFHRKSADPRVRNELVCPKCQSKNVKGVVE